VTSQFGVPTEQSIQLLIYHQQKLQLVPVKVIYGTNPIPDKYAAMACERRGGISLQIKSGLKIVFMVARCF
jgi:hypothetical protein